MRNHSIDMLKGILTILMILIHCIQFFADFTRYPILNYFSLYVNLTTFSGFVFCFGFSSYYAYVEREFKRKHFIMNLLKILVAFYISGFAYLIFVSKVPFGISTVTQLLTISIMPGYSEFLFSFVCVMILFYILRPLFLKINIFIVMGMVLISILSTFIPYSEQHPVIGSFIGGTNASYFPVIQYFCYFAAGYWIAKNKLVFKWKFLGFSMAASMVFFYISLTDKLPQRFPPSALWILGASGFIYGYFLILNKVKNKFIIHVLGSVGKKSLWFLLMSNGIIFAVSNTKFRSGNLLYPIALCAAIFAFCIYILHISQSKKTNPVN